LNRYAIRKMAEAAIEGQECPAVVINKLQFN
jgi:hypothetical protein